jgi:hypothetical protein
MRRSSLTSAWPRMTGRRRHRERKPAMPEAHPLDWQMPDGEPLWAFLERLADEAARQGPRFAEFRTAAAQKPCQGMVPILAAFLARHPHYAPRRLPPIFVDCLETLGHWRIVLAWQVPLSGPLGSGGHTCSPRADSPSSRALDGRQRAAHGGSAPGSAPVHTPQRPPASGAASVLPGWRRGTEARRRPHTRLG